MHASFPAVFPSLTGQYSPLSVLAYKTFAYDIAHVRSLQGKVPGAVV